MDELDAVVIGAGAAGLAAAARLGRAGQRVVLLEARERVGGRIWTLRERDWPRPVELGAEFIHGGNPVLDRLLRAAGIAPRPAPQREWLVRGGELKAADDAWDRIDAVMRRIGPRFRGSFAEWLERAAIPADDRLLAENFVKGFQGAPPERMSAHALYRATQQDEEQRMPPRGYDEVIASLLRNVERAGIAVRVGTVVDAVSWRRGRVTVAAGGERWRARAAVVTLPLGVLRAKPGGRGVVKFSPRLRAKEKVWSALETGYAVRVVLRLRNDAWRRGPIPRELRANNGRAFGFLQAEEEPFPVWRAEAPSPIVVGWTGGPAAQKMSGWPVKRVVRVATESLGRSLGCPLRALERLVLEARMHDWAADPFARGAYSYATARQENAPRRLAAPVAGTLFFAGEATADPLELGTVHGALASGERAAEEILRIRRRRAG